MTKHYANPDETVFVGSLFTFRFGAYGDTEVCVYQRPDCLDDALETAAEWLKEHQPGHLMPIWGDEHKELYREACEELFPGVTEADLTEEQRYQADEQACADLTHTESGYICSYEWTVDEEPCDGPPDATFDRFDIAQAYACYWAAWHQGQGSYGYERLCAAQRLFPGSDYPTDFSALTENGQAIYRRLVLADGR